MANLLPCERTASPHILTTESSQSSKAGTHLITLALRGNSEYRFQIWEVSTSWVKRECVLFFTEKQKTVPHTHHRTLEMLSHPKSKGTTPERVHHMVGYGKAMDRADKVCFLMHGACQISSSAVIHAEF